MTDKRNFTRLAGAVVAVALAQALIAAPVMAEEEATNDCVCVVPGGSVGLVTGATGWVKMNGDVGLVDAIANAPLSLGSVLQTGVAGSASASVGTCNVTLASLSTMSISQMQDGQMCVRVTQDQPPVVVGDNSGVGVIAAGGGAVLAGTLVVLGLGQENPVSK
jgi:hypothetical protein